MCADVYVKCLSIHIHNLYTYIHVRECMFTLSPMLRLPFPCNLNSAQHSILSLVLWLSVHTMVLHRYKMVSTEWVFNIFAGQSIV